MARVTHLLVALRRLPTLLRTLRHLRGEQARAQLRHLMGGAAAPVRLDAPAPRLAVAGPATDFLDPPAHVRAIGGSRIELLARPFDLGEVTRAAEDRRSTDWDSTGEGPLFAYHLHQHEYLRLDHFTPRERALRMLDWVRHHRRGVGWDPHPISLRLLCWGKLLSTPGSLELEAGEQEALLASMADQAETLRRGVEVRLQANHLLSNWIAVVWSGLLLDGGRSGDWLASASALAHEIEAQIHADGGHEERSPMYHALLLEAFLDLLNLCCAAPERVPAGLEAKLRSAAARMLEALEVWTHADGRIALFADSAFDVASEPARLVDYAARLGLSVSGARATSCLLPDSGYLRLCQGEVRLIASIAGPAPVHQPGHAHCDALAFELAFGSLVFVSDTGLYEYVPGPRRARSRETASHATLQIDGQEQAEIWAAHRIGGRPRVRLIEWQGGASAEAGCRSWSRPRTEHRRRWQVEAEGATIVDRIEGPCRHARLTLPLAPGWSVDLAQRSHAIARFTPPASGGESGEPQSAATADALATRRSAFAEMQIEVSLPPELAWRVEQAPFYPSFGCEVERAVLVGEGPGFSQAVTRIARVG
ncbi:MAG: heparinase II/III family protein [Deltaproteobacteria bacterium]|jgi:uncharacterized heparinase superfamily protein|nr:heparinase II/III family protein [Deltaproteobacteria bacterium]